MRCWWVACCAAPLAMALLQGCDNGCEQLREIYPHICFISTSGRQMRNIKLYYKSGDRIIEIRDAYTKFDDIEIDINPKETVTQLFAQCTYSDYGDVATLTDTITLTYKTEPLFLDLSCGCSVAYEFTDVDLTQHLLTGVKVNNSQVHTDSGINLTFMY